MVSTLSTELSSLPKMFYKTPIGPSTKVKSEKYDYVKLRNFFTSKEVISAYMRQTTGG